MNIIINLRTKDMNTCMQIQNVRNLLIIIKVNYSNYRYTSRLGKRRINVIIHSSWILLTDIADRLVSIVLMLAGVAPNTIILPFPFNCTTCTTD